MPPPSLRLTRYLDAPAADVWAALTEPDSIARWLARSAVVELASGGAFELVFDGAGTSMVGRVRALETGRVLELDWDYPGEEPSIVRFEIIPHERGTKLVLDHRRLDAVFCMRYFGRWERALDRLERAAGAGAQR